MKGAAVTMLLTRAPNYIYHFSVNETRVVRPSFQSDFLSLELSEGHQLHIIVLRDLERMISYQSQVSRG